MLKMGFKTTPKEIELYLKREAARDIEQDKRHDLLRVEEKNKLIAARVPSLRTIKESLRRLTQKRVLNDTKGTYTFHDNIKSDYRYLGQRFGEAALHYLMRVRYPATYKLEVNTNALIDIFGTYVVYCFVEATKSFQVADKFGYSNDDVDKQISTWVREVINPWTMFAYFISIMKHQPDDKEVMRYFKSLGNNGFKYKIQGGANLPFIQEDVVTPMIPDQNGPKYTLNRKVINKMLEIINKKNPEYYQQLNEVRERMLWELRLGISYGQKKSLSGRSNKGV